MDFGFVMKMTVEIEIVNFFLESLTFVSAVEVEVEVEVEMFFEMIAELVLILVYTNLTVYKVWV